MNTNLPLHNYIPEKIIRILCSNSPKCVKCSKKIDKNNITGIGIKQEGEKNYLFLEKQCPECGLKQITRYNKHYGIDDICYMILKEIQNLKNVNKSKSIENIENKKVITNIEFDECLKVLKSTVYHEDFMKYINAEDPGLNSKDD